MTDRRVVITGMGWTTALGLEVNSVWDALLAGKSGIAPIEHFDTSEFTSKIGGYVSQWDGSPHFSAQELKRMDRFTQLAMHAAVEAMNDSGLDMSKENPFDCGVLIGSGVGGIAEFEAGYDKMRGKGPKRVSPMMIPKLMINSASANVSIRYGMKGVNSAVVTACASAGHAIADAYKVIKMGEADVMVTGGAEAAMTTVGVATFMNMRALSTRNDAPTEASRPFDVDRDGFVIAEGAGILVVEEYEHAKARGAHIHAEITGYGMTGDGGHITAPDEQGRGAQEAIRRALRMGKLNPEDVQHVNAHATSTHLGDLAENCAIKTVFGDHAKNLAVSATKSMTGHLLGASGGIETIMLAKVLQTGQVPPTINLHQPDEGCDLNYVANEAQEHDVKNAISNSFGFGGHNVSVLLSKM